jgi:hypothetical protein
VEDVTTEIDSEESDVSMLDPKSVASSSGDGVYGLILKPTSCLATRGWAEASEVVVVPRASCLSRRVPVGAKRKIGPAEQIDNNRKERKSIARVVENTICSIAGGFLGYISRLHPDP